MIEYVQTNRKKILIYIGVLIGIVILLMPTKTKHLEVEYETSTEAYLESKKEITEEEKVSLMLNENMDTITFFSNTFLIDEDQLISKLQENYQELDFLNNSDNFDKIVLDYLIKLETEEKGLFKTTRVANTMDKEYIVKALKYFCSLYSNVDFAIAASIAQVESGYTSIYMLNKNNIFGGMYQGGLIGYKTIEYGVLKYVILLDEGYFQKGLNTIELIGKVYNPTFDENGQKIAKPTWVYNVTTAMDEFMNIDEVDTSMLNNEKIIQNILANK